MQQPRQEQLPAGEEDNERNENKMDFFLFFYSIIYVLFLFMEHDAMLWLFSFPVFHISHVIKDNVLLPSYILRHNVNILQRVLAKYLSWHPLF